MKTRGGFIQGYNAQNVPSADGLIIATRLTQDTGDVTGYEPMLRAAGDAASRIPALRPPSSGDAQPAQPPAGGAHPIGLFLADAGYLSGQNLTCPGPDRLIATGKHRDLEKAARDQASPGDGPGDGPDDGAIAAMATRLATGEGIAAYRQRGHIAETPHGNIKHNMNFDQLSLRGLAKAAAEWDFACTVHNLFKAITAGKLTSEALDRLASQAG